MQIQLYNQYLSTLKYIVSHTDPLECLLRIIDQVAQLHIAMPRTHTVAAAVGFKTLHRQLRDGIDILGVAQSIMLAHELTCPNEKGVYFYQRTSWQCSLGRLFLVSYACFRNLKWLAKLEFIQLGRIGSILIGNLTLIKLATDCSYIFYRVCTIAEGLRTKTMWRITVSVGKIAVVALSLLVCAWKVQIAALTMGITSLNLALDCYILKQRVYTYV